MLVAEVVPIGKHSSFRVVSNRSFLASAWEEDLLRESDSGLVTGLFPLISKRTLTSRETSKNNPMRASFFETVTVW